MESVDVALFFLIFSLFLFGAIQAGLSCAFLDVTPNYSTALNSLANFFGAIAGIVSPLVVAGFTTIWKGSWGWRASFLLTAVQVAIALYFWYYYQTSDIIAVLNSPRPRKRVAYRECCPWFRT
jgi:hypothetical protein